MDRWINGRIHGWMDGWMDGWMMDGWMKGMDGSMHSWMNGISFIDSFDINFIVLWLYITCVLIASIFCGWFERTCSRSLFTKEIQIRKGIVYIYNYILTLSIIKITDFQRGFGARTWWWYGILNMIIIIYNYFI